jgi:hypothetical protein
MATTQELRRAVWRLSTTAAADLNIVWRRASNAERTLAVLEETLPALIDAYGNASGTLAADWYDERRAQAAVRRQFQANPAGLRKGGGGAALAGWAVGPLFSESPDLALAQERVAGGLQLRIANTARDTITEASLADPSAQGWQRESSGGCAFCEMLASRGEVYSEESADFAAHDHCQCVAVPAFEGEPRPVQPYTPSARNITDADRTRVRAYIADQ